MDALQDVDALLVLTEWKCFQHPDFAAMARRMRERVIFDGRNLYDPALMQALGFVYQGIGRRNAAAQQRAAPLAASALPAPSRNEAATTRLQP
jgi:UDPglucose 6-dehydrogenase